MEGTCPLLDGSERTDELAFDGLRAFLVAEAPPADDAGEEGRVLLGAGDIFRALLDELAGETGRPLLTGVRDCPRGMGEAARSEVPFGRGSLIVA